MKERTVCFVGHRMVDPTEGGTLKTDLESTIRYLIRIGFTDFVIGGGQGFDTLAAQEVLLFKDEYPQIRLRLVLPSVLKNQGYYNHDVVVNNAVMRAADSIEYVSGKYKGSSTLKRNRKLIKMSSVCVCWLNRESGVTTDTIRFAINKNLNVVNLAEPNEIEGMIAKIRPRRQ